MSSGRIELTILLSSNTPVSIFYWITLLNFFEEYQTDLDIDDIQRLVAECERCRTEYNTNHKNTDKIRKEDTRPNIYSHLDVLETKEQYHNDNKESLPTTQQVAVAQ